MPFIENVSRSAIEKGQHHSAGLNAMLIQITDPDSPFPLPLYSFRKVAQYRFWDTEDDEDLCPQYMDAINLVENLRYALANNMNVVVHCQAGLCRSGAVAEIGKQMGFIDCERPKWPNRKLYSMMADIAGFKTNMEEYERMFDMREFMKLEF